MKLFLEKLKQIRKQQKITAEELANKMGLHRTTYCAWESGRVIPNEGKIRMLARVLDISVDEISDLEPDKPVSPIQYSEAIQDWLSIASGDKEKHSREIAVLISGITHINRKLTNTKLIIDSLLSAIPSIFYIKDTSLKYIAANDSFLKSLSLKKNYIVLNKVDSDFFPQREASFNEEQDRQVFISGKSIIEEGFIPGTRKKKWGIISKIPVYDADSKVAGLVGSFVDITDIVKKQKSLDAFNEAILASGDLIWIGKYEGVKKIKYIYLSDNTEKVFGIKKEELIKDPEAWLNNVHPADKNRVSEWGSLTDYPKEIEYRVIFPGNTVKWIYTRICAKGEMLYGTSYSINKRKENEIRRVLIENAMYCINDVLWIIDSTGKCVMYSGNPEKLYGKSFESANDPLAYWQENLLHPDYKAKNDILTQNFLKTAGDFKEKDTKNGELVKVPESWKYKIKKPDGTELFIETTFSCMVCNGELYALALDRDITGRDKEADLKIERIKEYINNSKNIPDIDKEKLLDLC